VFLSECTGKKLERLSLSGRSPLGNGFTGLERTHERSLHNPTFLAKDPAVRCLEFLPAEGLLCREMKIRERL
jgi:hypothetical protein